MKTPHWELIYPLENKIWILVDAPVTMPPPPKKDWKKWGIDELPDKNLPSRLIFKAFTHMRCFGSYRSASLKRSQDRQYYYDLKVGVARNLAKNNKVAQYAISEELKIDKESAQEELIKKDPTLLETEKTQLILARRGQGKFRQEVLKKWKGVCAITGFKNSPILIASHIKEWSESNDNEKMDVENGLLLIPNLDKLFDKHLISFTENGEIIISSTLSIEDCKILGISNTLKLRQNMSDTMKQYMAIHREKLIR